MAENIQPARTGPVWDVGCQTIIWGQRIDDLEYALSVISAAGFQGIEIAQRPDTLPDYPALQSQLAKHKLRLFGLAGGSILERMKYLDGDTAPYLYVDTWNEQHSKQAIKDRFHLCIHPHMYKQFQRMETVTKWMWDHPQIYWMPDTAHLWIAGEPLEGWFLKRLHERTKAIHFKDWTPVFGRWSHRYARGFTGLGNGHVPLEDIWKKIQSITWPAGSRFYIAEQDTPGQSSIAEAVFHAAEWLAGHEVSIKPDRTALPREPSPARSRAVVARPVERSLALLESFENLLRPNTSSSAEYYTKAAEYIRRLQPACRVEIWAYSPAHNLISLLGMAGDSKQAAVGIQQRDQFPLEKVASRIAVERNAPTEFDLNEKDPGERYGYKGSLVFPVDNTPDRPCSYYYCLPIPNSYNSHHTRLLVHFITTERLGATVLEQLFADCCDLARVFDAWLSERCVTAAGEVNAETVGGTGTEEFCTRLVLLLRKTLPCEAATIFRVWPPGILREAASSGLVWKESEKKQQYYARGEGYTGQVFKDRTPMLTHRDSEIAGRKGKSFEVVQDPKQDECLIAPMIAPDGTVWGVLRCRNKLAAETKFSDDDLAITNAVLDAAMPTLVGFSKAERDRLALMQTVHELNKPLGAVRGALDEMQTELRNRPSPFSFDYIEDALSWTELMAKVLEAKDYLNDGPINPLMEPTLLLKHVVAPAKRQSRLALRERGYGETAIYDNGFRVIPELNVDRNLMQQVIFNFLENAIKYGPTDPDKFRAEVFGVLRWEEGKRYYAIVFKDWGIGVTEGWEEQIFEKGIRAEEAERLNVQGHGLGLWIVRKLVTAHGGTVRLTRNKNPTEFTVFLPETLATGASLLT